MLVLWLPHGFIESPAFATGDHALSAALRRRAGEVDYGGPIVIVQQVEASVVRIVSATAMPRIVTPP
jgi:hypothetical protein